MKNYIVTTVSDCHHLKRLLGKRASGQRALRCNLPTSSLLAFQVQTDRVVLSLEVMNHLKIKALILLINVHKAQDIYPTPSHRYKHCESWGPTQNIFSPR